MHEITIEGDWKINPAENIINRALETLSTLYQYQPTDLEAIDQFIQNRLAVKYYRLIWLNADPKYFNLNYHKTLNQFLLPIDQALIITDLGQSGQLLTYPADLKIHQKEVHINHV